VPVPVPVLVQAPALRTGGCMGAGWAVLAGPGWTCSETGASRRSSGWRAGRRPSSCGRLSR
jgi:hypothetical protein